MLIIAYYSSVWIHHNLYRHTIVAGQLDGFQLEPIMNSAIVVLLYISSMQIQFCRYVLRSDFSGQEVCV